MQIAPHYKLLAAILCMKSKLQYIFPTLNNANSIIKVLLEV